MMPSLVVEWLWLMRGEGEFRDISTVTPEIGQMCEILFPEWRPPGGLFCTYEGRNPYEIFVDVWMPLSWDHQYFFNHGPPDRWRPAKTPVFGGDLWNSTTT